MRVFPVEEAEEHVGGGEPGEGAELERVGRLGGREPAGDSEERLPAGVAPGLQVLEHVGVVVDELEARHPQHEVPVEPLHHVGDLQRLLDLQLPPHVEPVAAAGSPDRPADARDAAGGGPLPAAAVEGRLGDVEEARALGGLHEQARNAAEREVWKVRGGGGRRRRRRRLPSPQQIRRKRRRSSR